MVYAALDGRRSMTTSGPVVDVAVLGAGIAGLAAADELRFLGRSVTIFERSDHVGGHTHSIDTGGFVFDEGPHVSFTKHDAIRDQFERNAGSIEEFTAKITNAYRGTWLTHPAQCHLHGADLDLIARCIEDLVESRVNPIDDPKNYAEWCIDGLGRAFAEEFTFRYTRKYWTVEAAEMTTDWVGNRMYPPTIGEVVRGALSADASGDFHYLSTFRYPSGGGFQSFLRGMGAGADVRLGKKVTVVDVERRELGFSDGSRIGYGQLLSTMPLPLLIGSIPDNQVPAAVKAAATRLRCTSMVLVDIAVARHNLFPCHWFYVYDEDLLISRGHFPHMLSAANAPEGCGAIQLEVYFGDHKPLPCTADEVVDTVVGELIDLGILRGSEEVIWSRGRTIEFANVLFDHERAPALELIQPWLDSVGIASAGRYGEWGYLWTDDSLISGQNAARRLAG
jgi:protoporphyrinogen oxidase